MTDPLSAGCNRLLKLGAGLILSEEEFLEELIQIGKRQGLQAGNTNGGNTSIESTKNLPPELAAVYHALDVTPGSVEEITARLPKEYREEPVNIHLVRLCLENLALQVSPGQFCLRGGESGR